MGHIHGFAALLNRVLVRENNKKKVYESPVCCDMICQGLALVGFVFTVRAVELKDASVSILAILHLVEAHVTMSTLITPARK